MMQVAWPGSTGMVMGCVYKNSSYNSG